MRPDAQHADILRGELARQGPGKRLCRRTAHDVTEVARDGHFGRRRHQCQYYSLALPSLDQVLDRSERVLHLGYKSHDFTQLIISQQKELVHACEENEVSGIVKLARSQCLFLKKQVIEALLAGFRLQEVNLQPFAQREHILPCLFTMSLPPAIPQRALQNRPWSD